MTIEEAINELEESKRQNEVMRDNPNTFFKALDVEIGQKNAQKRIDALNVAISALRAQQWPNVPLSLEQLKRMNGEPVWWWNTSAKPVCMICVFNRFMVEPMFANYDFVSEDAVNLTKYKWLKKCGYKPYRQKPREEADHG